MRFTLLLSVFFFCASLKAQTGEALKSFINKNNIAIRSIQKGIPVDDAVVVSQFKTLLKEQQSAVKLYSADKTLSAYFAFKVRNECIRFLKAYSKGSTSYFEISESERALLKTEKTNNQDVISSNDIKTIEGIDLKDAQSLNALTLTIQ